MTASRFISFVLYAYCIHTSCVYANEAEWNRLGNEVAKLQREGRIQDAQMQAKHWLEVAERLYGTNHPNVALSLNNYAMLLTSQGKYTEAEPLLRRVLAINERSLGAEHLIIATSLGNYAGTLHYLGKYAEAESKLRRALAINEKVFGPEHISVATNINNLAAALFAQNKFAETEQLFKRVMAINEKLFGQEHPEIATNLSNLAVLFVEQGKYSEADPLHRRAISILEKSLGVEHTAVANSLNNLALLYKLIANYAEAEQLYRRALSIREKTLGVDHPDVATSLNNLATLLDSQGKYSEAESLHRRAIMIFEKSLGAEHTAVATSLGNLAEPLREMGKYAEAELLTKRALAINEKALGADHLSVAWNCNALAVLLNSQGKYAEAEPLYRRALTIQEKSLGPEHPIVATSLNNLAELYRLLANYSEAERLHRRALSIRERSFGADHPDVASSLNNLAGLLNSQSKYIEAQPLLMRSLAIRERILGLEHPDVAFSLGNLAELSRAQGRYSDSLVQIRRANAIYRARIIHAGVDDRASLMAATNRTNFTLHLSLLARNPLSEPADHIADESLQIAQLGESTGTAAAVAKMAARFARGDDELAILVRRRQDASEHLRLSEEQQITAVSQPPDKRRPSVEQVIRDSIATATKDIAGLDTELNQRFPSYQTLTKPEPLTLAQVKSQLREGEGLLVYAFGENTDGEHGFGWLITPTSARFIPINIKGKALVTSVAKIRNEIDLNPFGQLTHGSINDLHTLYKSLVAPFKSDLMTVKHLMVVPAGPLQSLPLSMLVATPSTKIVSGNGSIDWLVKHYAISYLPSVGSIRAFRQFAKTAANTQSPFAGIGDPVIGSDEAQNRGNRGRINIAMIFRNNKKSTNTPISLRAVNDIADVNAIRAAPRLPETEDELKAMAVVLKADKESIWLREQATETRIKQADLGRYRTLAFATHGVMAGELQGIGEPGLILTPPKIGTLEDDGYLSASEVAQLKLNADWVLLSACNTAAGDGSIGAEGFSGLAKAFFYAGARSLLVSHWPVDSKATVMLTTKMLQEFQLNPGQGKAEAHRKSILAMMNDQKNPHYAHPMFWAPFVVVGEAGGRLSN